MKSVGKLEGWKVEKLGDVIQKTETINPLQTPNKEFIYIDVSSVNNKTLSIEETSLIKGKDAPSRARKLIKAGDVIFATVRPTLKRIAIIPEEYDQQVCSTGYFVLRAKEFINNKYLFYYLQTDSFNERMEKLQKGASYPAVTDTEVKEQIISYPPLPEQQRIVSVLDEAFASIAQAKSNAERNLVNARELFDTASNEIISNSSNDWKEMKLGDVCSFIRGPFGGSLKKNVFKSAGYAVYEQRHAIHKDYSEIRYFIDEEKFKEMARFELHPGELIMSCSGVTLGRVSIAPENMKPGIINQALLKLSPIDKKISVEFLKLWMESESFQVSIRKYSQGAAIPNVASVKILKDIPIHLPSLAEQRAIVERLEALSAETGRLEEIYEQKVEGLDELKKSVLAKAFDGEL